MLLAFPAAGNRISVGAAIELRPLYSFDAAPPNMESRALTIIRRFNRTWIRPCYCQHGGCEFEAGGTDPLMVASFIGFRENRLEETRAIMGEREAKRIAAWFYGQPPGLGAPRCVVEDTEQPNWHHLDEARVYWWDPVNIIPLSGWLNSLLDKRRYRPLPKPLTPADLESTAKEHFKRGRFAQGYACHRLGGFLKLPPRGDVALGYPHDPDGALYCSANALLNLRAISAIRFGVDTLRRSVIPILEKHMGLVTNLTAARLVIEIGSYYRDYGIAREALRCCNLADRLLAGASGGPVKELLERLAQHRQIAMLANRDTTTVFSESGDESCMSRRAGLYLEARSVHLLYTARAILAAKKPDLDRCHAAIAEIYSLREKLQVSNWLYAEAVWTEADCDHLRGKSARAEEIVAHGQTLFYGAGIVPTATLPPVSVRCFTEKYPKDIFVSPRRPDQLIEFMSVADKALTMIRTARRRRHLGPARRECYGVL